MEKYSMLVDRKIQYFKDAFLLKLIYIFNAIQ